MGNVRRSEAGLRFFGDDLNPDEISKLLGSDPTVSWRKGDVLIGHNITPRTAKTGSWRLSAKRREPEDLEAQILELLAALSQDMAIWRGLSLRYKTDLFCGIYMSSFNDGLPLTSETLLALGLRGIALDLDIYDAHDD